MAIATVPGTGHAELCERPYQHSLTNAFNVLKPRSVTTFALDIKIGGVRDLVVSCHRAARSVSVASQRVAAVTLRRLDRARRHRGIGAGVLGHFPAGLEVDVAIAACRLLCRRVEIAEKS